MINNHDQTLTLYPLCPLHAYLAARAFFFGSRLEIEKDVIPAKAGMT